MLASERAALKSAKVEEGPRTLHFGHNPDLEAHMAAVRRELAGLPELCFHQARLVTLIRRRLDLAHVVPEFFALWRHEGAFLAEHLTTKWLVSAADTYADHGTDAERPTALLITSLVLMMKLSETERRALADKTLLPARFAADAATVRGGRNVELWDGVRLYNADSGDAVHLLLDRAARFVAGHPALEPILRTVVARAIAADTLFGRFAAMRPDFLPPAMTGDAVPEPAPRFVGARHGFGFVLHRGRYYALPQSLGPVDLEKTDAAALPGVIVADRIVDAVERAAAVGLEPPALVETHGAFNIVRYRGKMLAVPHALGAIDLAACDLGRLRGLIVADDLDAARAAIDAASTP